MACNSLPLWLTDKLENELIAVFPSQPLDSWNSDAYLKGMKLMSELTNWDNLRMEVDPMKKASLTRLVCTISLLINPAENDEGYHRECS
ncbi:unnamed protein product [Caenorhabditis sp. 36 PRJEB53466]|nr:unnamed protein product [Caenorhabditis sp. 36 PRJEB53466]